MEQIEWIKGVKTITENKPKYIYLIIQEQNEDTDTITINVKSRDSIRRFSEMVNPKLVPRNELVESLNKNNYILEKIYEQQVPNNKTMVGLVFININ